MPHLSPALARRVDRLARRAHAFHRWAHHPVCERYAGEVVRLGRRTRLCRGCLLAAAGAAAGILTGLVLPLPRTAGAAGAGLAALAAGWAVGRPAGPAGATARATKVLTRFLPTLCAGLAVGQARPGAPPSLLVALLGLAAVGAALLRYRRRGPDRRACAGCPAGPPSPACPGFARQVARERALRRLAGRWIAAERRRATAPPPAPPGAGWPRSA